MKFISLKKLFASLILFVPVSLMVAQNKQYTLDKEKTEISVLVDRTKTTYTAADMQYGKRGTAMLEARIYDLGISMDTVGFWSAFSGKENIWKLNIKVPEAKRFFISFDDFYIPEGAQLYAYNKSNTTDAVIYTHKDNPGGGPYSLENMSGDNVVLEYVTSDKATESPRMVLSNIGYKYTTGTNQHNDFNTSQPCMININCPEGEKWQDQKRGIVLLRITRNSNTYLCSGTMINNTTNDKTPYLLTSEHCFENMTPESIAPNTAFIFEYELPTCEIKPGDKAPKYKYHKGSEVLVLNPIEGGSDGALLKLSEKIPDDWDVYFNGWDRENKPAANGAVIHHPKGDVKKISFYEKAPVSGKWSSKSQFGTHWVVYYSEGATEGGSSGSPLFNQAGLITGTLTGGDNNCNNPDISDAYGKLWYHWDQYKDTEQHMKKYLDPKNSGATKIAGINNNINIDKNIVLDNTVLSLTIDKMSDVNILDGNGEYTAISSDNNVATVEITDRKINIKGLNGGTADITVTDKKNKKAIINVRVHHEIEYSVANNELKVSIYKDEDAIERVRIINLTGNTVYDKKGLDEKEHTIPSIKNLARDTYIIQVFTKKGHKEAKKITW
ncbi:Ig-like domain-containing protein [Prevotella sp. 10(H)]|uniref:Ig-like domain-containing protein n=1 Tax=Prevotella sp. 10(H) TaxID=1158294 RepID=UPI0004A74DD2|nr:Ig-like domain-containing protein [Prevotella sp. 10(H)]